MYSATDNAYSFLNDRIAAFFLNLLNFGFLKKLFQNYFLKIYLMN